MKRIALLGSTGSIGRQTLDVVRCNKEQFAVTALAVHSNTKLLAEQLEEFRPKYAVIADKTAGAKFKAAYSELVTTKRELAALAPVPVREEIQPRNTYPRPW